MINNQTELSKEQQLKFLTRRADQLCHENKLLFSLIARISLAQQPEKIAFSELASKYLKPVAQLFKLERDQRQALALMSQLTFLGQAVQLNPPNDDPYCFAQTEWLLRESNQLSLVGISMRLSLEKFDGQGPQALVFEEIPAIALAYRCLLILVEQHIMHSDKNVINSGCCLAWQRYFPSSELTKLVSLLNHQDAEKIKWFAPMQLRAGLKVMDDVRNETGLLLIAKQTVLTEAMISSLINYQQKHGALSAVPACEIY